MNIKKFVLMLTCLAVFLNLFLISPLADNESSVSGDFEYSVCPDTASEEYRGTIEITRYLGTDSDVVIPAEIDGKKVTVIGDNLFYKNENLKSVKLPDTIISIGTEAFSLCKSLETVNIPSGVKEIGGAFRGCEKLTSIVIPEGVESIYFDTFKDCTALKNVQLPNGLKMIYDFAFENCTSLSEIAIPDGAEEIGSGVFAGCTALFEISIPESVSDMGNGVFSGSAIYDDEKNWEHGVLYVSGCLADSKREEISGEFSVKNGTRIIANNALSKSEKLETLKLPAGLKNIGVFAFADCTSLKTVELSNGIETIGDSAFKSCAMENIIIPEGVKTIGENAFQNGKLKKVTLPKSLETIGDGAFEGNSIYTIRYNGTETEWNEKQLSKSLTVAPYTTMFFGEEESDSDISDKDVVLSQTDPENEVSETEKNGRNIYGVIIVIVLAVIVVICGIAVVCMGRKSKNQ